MDGAAELAAILADERRNAVVLGPGGGVGPAMRELVEAALASARGGRARRRRADELCRRARARCSRLIAGARAAPVVLTPHEGEFARLFNAIHRRSNVHAKLERARLAAAISRRGRRAQGPRYGGGRAGRPRRDRRQRAALARHRGRGDVLAGFVGGLLAQGMPAFEAAARRGLAAWRGRPTTSGPA